MSLRTELRGSAILAALRNGKTLALEVDPTLPCVKLPAGLTKVTLSLKRGDWHAGLRVSPLGLHAIGLRNYGAKVSALIPWYAITKWRQVKK